MMDIYVELCMAIPGPDGKQDVVTKIDRRTGLVTLNGHPIDAGAREREMSVKDFSDAWMAAWSGGGGIDEWARHG